MRSRARRFAVGVGVVAVMAVLAPFAPAQADDVTITAAVPEGTRVITAAAPVLLSENGVGTATSLQGTYSFVVTETARSGTNPWSLNSRMSNLVSGLNTINSDKVSVDNRAVTDVYTLPLAFNGTESAPSGSEAYTTTSTDRTLFSIAGEDPATLYTGTFTGTGLLTTDASGATGGVYTGTLTITLIE